MASCTGCRQAIIGTSVGPAHKRYHPQCFRCSNCQRELGLSFCKTKDAAERPLCEGCFGTLYSEKCYACQQPILSTKTLAMGRAYHVEHFTCAVCRVPLGSTFFPGADGKPYCPQHVPQQGTSSQQQYTPPTLSTQRICTGCRLPIGDSQTPLYAMSQYWHTHCFVCSVCRTNVQGGNAYPHQNTLYCKPCYVNRVYGSGGSNSGSDLRRSEPVIQQQRSYSPTAPLSTPAPAPASPRSLPQSQSYSSPSSPMRNSAPSPSINVTSASTTSPSHSPSPASPRAKLGPSTPQTRPYGNANASQILLNDGRNKADLPGVLHPGRKSRKSLNQWEDDPRAKTDEYEQLLVDAAPTPHMSLSLSGNHMKEVDPLDQWVEQKRMATFEWPKNAEPRDTSLITNYDWPVELGSPYVDEEDVLYSHIEREQFYYRDFLAKSDSQQHYFVLTGPEQPPAILTVETKSERKQGASSFFRALLRTEKADERVLLSVPSSLFSSGEKARLHHLKGSSPVMARATKVKKVNDPRLTEDLLEFERKQNNTNFKFGVLYCKPGQTSEEQMYLNKEGSPAFEEFLKFIGDKIPLVGHVGYTGGLSVFNDATGKHTIYTRFREFEIMFHVSTYIPISEDTQQVERKRHLGNDIVIIIFKDGSNGNDSFTPEDFKSHFNHIYAVVQPVAGSVPTSYKFSIMYKPGVKPNKPFLPHPAIFTKDPAFRNLFLTKLINAEISSLQSPEFLTSMRRTRKEMLNNIVQKYKPKMRANK